MEDAFATVYELFINVYGSDLGEHLYGINCEGNDEGGLYTSIGFALIFTSTILVLAYYYWFVSPSRNRWYHWLIWLGLNFFVSFLIGFYLPYRDLTSGFICENFLVTVDNTIFFGLINGFLSAILFTIISNLARWGSADGRLTPMPR